MSMDTVPIRWSLPARVAFRFVVAYLVLYNLSGLIWFIPWKGEWLAQKYSWPWDQLGVWVGDTLFGVDAHRNFKTGSGDTWADYVLCFNQVVIAALATVVWSLRDRRRESYPQLLDAVRSLVRIILGATLITYGMAKVAYTQFAPIDGSDLMTTYGESSPMGLLWRFMGHSYAYNLFTGGIECLAGVLLFWRRTTLLGALLGAAAMTQVFVLNMCFDVCVKLYSFHLLLMAVWLVLPDLRRLVDFFVMHRSVEVQTLRTPFARPWLERARRPVKILVLAAMLYKIGDDVVEQYTKYGPGNKGDPMHQLYQVERHAIAGVEKPPLTTDATRWKYLVIGKWGYAGVTFMDGHTAWFACAIDKAASTITLTSNDKTKSPDLVLRYTYPDADHLDLSVDIEGAPHAIHVTIRRPSSFLIRNRGFHWHNEYAFNR